MHPKAVIVLLLVLALCRCGVGWPGKNSKRGKPQTTPIEVLSDDDDNSNDWSSAVTRPTMTQTRVGGYVIHGSSNYTYGLHDPTLPSNSFTINNWNPSQTQNVSNATPSTSSKAKTGAAKIARVADRTNSLTSNFNTSPPNVSPQNANIGRNNAAAIAFWSINAGGNSRGSQTPSATIGGSSNNNGIGLSRFANPNNRLPPNNVSQNANIGSINTGGNSREIQKPSAIIGVISNPNNRLAPNNFSQNPNIGRNNAAGSAFQRYNATSTGETNTSAAGFTLDGTNTSNLTSNNNRPRGSQKPKSAFYSYKKS